MKQVLVVEPNKVVAETIREYLERDDLISVSIASNAQDAIHCADEKKPDVVILELAMQSQNGFAFLHEFRSYADWSNVPVIVHSHLAQNEAQASKSWKLLDTAQYYYKPQTTLAKLKKGVYEVLDI